MFFSTKLLETATSFFPTTNRFNFQLIVLRDYLDSFCNNIYTKLFNFNYVHSNHDLLNITSLYSYILSIEILIVICVLFIHSSVIGDDMVEITEHNRSENGYYIVNDAFSILHLQMLVSSNTNTAIGIGHELESFLDFFFLVIPTSIIIYILVPSLGLLYNKEFELDYSDTSFTVDIIAHQWYWSYQPKSTFDNGSGLVDYVNESSFELFDSIMTDEKPRFLAVDNTLYLPVYTKILFVITSEDVIHSFSIPDVGIKVDAIPGRLAIVDAFFISEGIYKGQCSELCGANHAFMPISIALISRASYFSSIIDINMLFDFLYIMDQ